MPVSGSWKLCFCHCHLSPPLLFPKAEIQAYLPGGVELHWGWAGHEENQSVERSGSSMEATSRSLVLVFPEAPFWVKLHLCHSQGAEVAAAQVHLTAGGLQQFLPIPTHPTAQPQHNSPPAGNCACTHPHPQPQC